MVHSKVELENAMEASQILFGKGTTESLTRLDERTFLSIFEGVPQFSLNRPVIVNGISLPDLLADKTRVFTSKGELRRLVQGGGVSINKIKVTDSEMILTPDILLNNKYILVQKGKKNYYLITIK